MPGLPSRWIDLRHGPAAPLAACRPMLDDADSRTLLASWRATLKPSTCRVYNASLVKLAEQSAITVDQLVGFLAVAQPDELVAGIRNYASDLQHAGAAPNTIRTYAGALCSLRRSITGTVVPIAEVLPPKLTKRDRRRRRRRR